MPWRAYQLYVINGKATLAAMCLRRVRVVSRAAVGRITSIVGLYLVSSEDLRFCRLRGRFSILGIWLVQLLPWLRFRVLHVDADKNWA
jgi:hypothetical protein